MKKWSKLVLPGIVTLLPMLVGIYLWNRLPEEMATHFTFDGTPNGYTSRAFTVFGIPLVLLAAMIFCFAVTGTKYQKNAPERVFMLMIWIIPICSLIVLVTVYGYALNIQMDFRRIVFIFLGVLFAAIGNYLPKIRQNAYMGIKLPWTLMDEENWNKTHRMAGPIWVVAGLLSAILGALNIGNGVVEAVLLGLMVGIPCVYSFVLSLKKK